MCTQDQEPVSVVPLLDSPSLKDSKLAFQQFFCDWGDKRMFCSINENINVKHLEHVCPASEVIAHTANILSHVRKGLDTRITLEHQPHPFHLLVAIFL